MKKVYYIATAGDGIIQSLFDVELRKEIAITEHPKLKNIHCPMGIGVWADFPEQPGLLVAEEVLLCREPYSEVIDVLGNYPYNTHNNEHPDWPERVILTLNETWLATPSCAKALGAFGEPTHFGSLSEDLEDDGDSDREQFKANFNKAAVFIGCRNRNCNTEQDAQSIYGGFYLLRCPVCGNVAFSVSEDAGTTSLVSPNRTTRGNRHIKCLNCSWGIVDGIDNPDAVCPKCSSTNDWQTIGFNPNI